MFSLDEENADDELLHLAVEVLQATLTRTGRPRHGDKGVGKRRVSGAPANPRGQCSPQLSQGHGEKSC